MNKFLFFLLPFFLFSCENIPNPFQEDETEVIVDPTEEEEEYIDIEHESPHLIAKLDRLTIRADSSRTADFLTKVGVGDTLIYLGEHSQSRLNLVIRKKYYHEPWLKVKIQKSEKEGWVYAGGVKFASNALKRAIRNTGYYSKQIHGPERKEKGAVPTSWSTASISNPKDFKTFLVHFKEWVAMDNIEEISKHIDYPADPVWNKGYFKEYYSEIFDDSLKTIIRNQRLDNIFRKEEGAMFGNGEIWFAKRKEGYRVVAFNAFAKKVKDLKEINDYRTEFAALENFYTRPTKEANPPSLNITFEEQLLIAHKIAYLGNQKQEINLGGFKYRFSESSDILFEQKVGRDIQRKLTFKPKKDSTYHVILDDIKDYSMGQRFILK